MSNADKIKEFMAKHGVAKDEVWLVPGGKSYAIKHTAIERIAFQHNVHFGQPTILEANGYEGSVALIVTGKLGDFEQWATGEAAPRNNKNAYPWAMAEKRAKDRVVLKLLNIHGILYSEAEADEMREPAPAKHQPRSASQMTPAQIAAVKDQEFSESEKQAFEVAMKMIASAPTAAALDAVVKSDDWLANLEVLNADDRPRLRKEYASRRETLTHAEAK